jgi:hypothetical protein
MDGSGSKFYVSGDNVRLGFRELLSLAERHDLGQILDLEKEEVVISAKLLAGMARADVVDAEADQLQYVDAAAVGLFMAGTLFGLLAVFLQDLQQARTIGWVIFIVSIVMMASYVYQGLRSGFIKKLWKKYLAKMARDK